MLAEAAARPARWELSKQLQEYASGFGVAVTAIPTGNAIGYMNGPWAHHTNDIAVDGSFITTHPNFRRATTFDGSAGAMSLPRCSINCSNQGEIYAFHTGGAQVVMGDASTHFLSASMDLRTLLLLCARGDGAPVSMEQ
jgi:hypothetical protein